MLDATNTSPMYLLPSESDIAVRAVFSLAFVKLLTCDGIARAAATAASVGAQSSGANCKLG